MSTLVEYCIVEAQWMTKSYGMHACVHDWTLAGLNKRVDPDSYWYEFDCVASSIDRDKGEYHGHLRHSWLTPHAARLAHDRFIRAGLLNEIADDRVEEAEYIALLLPTRETISCPAGTVCTVISIPPTMLKAPWPILALYLLYLTCTHASGAYDRKDKASYLTTQEWSIMALILGENGSTRDAVQLTQQVVELRKSKLGDDHPDTLRSMHSLTIEHSEAGRRSS
ncbi:hypothetical protein GJ744_006034 [Endocarpon pusillum]|uniref:Kinesin light chain n=1 Tax=Endocarpon pusillum TaxID=364733 RepID=A0A8H7AK81_9EURO|nr:hypothetical protein GJ744_006034 [Endocarpon pusillum]